MQAITKVFSDIVKPYIDSENQTLANEVKENWSDNKNLLPPILYNNAASITYIGVTLTIDDLKFKITGTASGDGGRLNLRTDPFMLKAGTYTVSGVIGAATAVHKTSDNSVIISRVTPNEDATFTLETDTSVFVGINVANGITYNQTVGLQIEKGSSATPYQPYAKSNTKLTKDDSGLTANAFANGAVNLLENKATSQVINGITWVVNSDGTITASGTATARSYIQITDVTLPAGTYRLSGTPKGGNYSSSYGLGIESLSKFDNGDGVEFTLSSETTFSVILNIRTGTGAINIAFKPMITLADMPNSDYDHYVPYAKSNKELTDAMALFSNAISREITPSTSWAVLENMGTYVMDGVPFTGNWSIVLVLKRNENTGVQIAFRVGAASDVSSNYIAYRMYYSGTWSNWAAVNATNMP